MKPLKINLLGKEFVEWISESEIQKNVIRLSKEIEEFYAEEKPILVAVLNGAFIFAADLIRELNGEWRIEFVKTSSYSGKTSSGKIQTLIGVKHLPKHRHLLILEDILDTGLTLEKMIEDLKKFEPKSVKIAVMFDKPASRKNQISADFIGISIEPKFIVGYGLDYIGFGRNLKSVFVEIAHP